MSDRHTFAVRLPRAKNTVKVIAKDWQSAAEKVLHTGGWRQRTVHAINTPVRLFSAHAFKFAGRKDQEWGGGKVIVKLVAVDKPKGKSIAIEGTGSCFHQSALGVVLHCRLSRSTAFLPNSQAKTVVDKLGKCKTQAEIDTVIRGVV